MNNKWRKLLYWLRKTFPTDYPITVRCKDKITKDNDLGMCIQFDDNSIRIDISNKQCFNLKVDALLHEWAHALTIDSKNIDEHGDDWGKTYSRIYRKFLKWNFGQEIYE